MLVTLAASVPGPARLAPTAAAAADWHNHRARLLLDLDERLEQQASDAAREALLGRLAKALEAPDARVDQHQGG